MAAAEDEEIEGKAVDSRGYPAVDPSENVKALSEAANKRQDDLREANDRLFEARLDGIKEFMKLRAECSAELVAAESRRVNEQLTLRAAYSERLEIAEAKRIDAIRAVDVNAVAVASQRAADQATVLAAQVATSAEALRALVASTAASSVQSQQQLAATFSTRITTLEQAQYEGKGKQAYSDPAFSELLAEVKVLRDQRSGTAGVSQGVGTTWAAIGVVAGLIIAGLGVGFAVTRPAPQATYLSAPGTNPATPPR